MSPPTRVPARSRGPSSRMRGSSPSADSSTSTTSCSGRSPGSRPTPAVLARWRGRCAHLLVDEVQDVDRAQLRLALLLAAPANRILLVGDDDQSIYGWRLADVRRVLGLDALLDGLRRVDLEVNYRCPAPVVERAVRLVARNQERFAKRIRAGPVADGRLVLAPDGDDDAVRLERVMRTWPDDGSTQAVLARTNRELIPAVVVAHGPRPAVPGAAARAAARGPGARRPARRGRRARRGPAGRCSSRSARSATGPPRPAPADLWLATALLAWAAGYRDVDAFAAPSRTAGVVSPACAATTRP